MGKIRINRKFLVRAKKALRELRGREREFASYYYYETISTADEELPYFIDGFSNEMAVEIELPDRVVKRLSDLKPLVERMGGRCEDDFVAP